MQHILEIFVGDYRVGSVTNLGSDHNVFIFDPAYVADADRPTLSLGFLNAKGELQKYVAGLPFPFIDLNDPQAANKIVWNFSYGPQAADFIHARNIETSSYRDVGPPGSFLSKILPADPFHSTARHLVGSQTARIDHGRS